MPVALEAIHAYDKFLRYEITMCESTMLQGSAPPGLNAKQNGRFLWWENTTLTRLRYRSQIVHSARALLANLQMRIACLCTNMHCLQISSLLPTPGSSALLFSETSRSLCINIPKSTLLQMPRNWELQTYKGPMTLLEHQQFRLYEQEPAGVSITVGLQRGSAHSFWGGCCAGR